MDPPGRPCSQGFLLSVINDDHLSRINSSSVVEVLSTTSCPEHGGKDKKKKKVLSGSSATSTKAFKRKNRSPDERLYVTCLLCISYMCAVSPV